MRNFKKLDVWFKAHQLTLEIYKATQNFSDDERFGLTSQIRRASASIPTNLAEGCGRDSDAELKRFCHIAMGSANEVEYQLILARDLGYIETTDYQTLSEKVIEIKRMLTGYIKSI
jgi:four helix bundle protein